LIFRRSDNVVKVHAVIAGEEGKREKYDSDDGEYHDSFVLRIRDDGEFILFDGAELKELVVLVRNTRE